MSDQQERKYHILIVDDTSKNIQVLANVLKQKNYQISAAKNGYQAIDIVEETTPDLILLDIMMPEMDGFETCQRLKKDDKTRDIPIIFLTAKNEGDDIIKGFELGAVDYITKPFNSAELLMRVKTHLDLRLSKEIIQRQSNERKELLHVVCHDLVNPMAYIIGILDLAEEDVTVFKQMKDRMRMAMTNGINMIAMVREMRALEEGKLHFDLEHIDLKQTLDESTHMFKQKLSKKSLELVIRVDENLYVYAERVSFVNSVLNNIITNAIKFSYPDTKIVIDGKLNNDKAIISIKDSGMGIPEDLLRDLFNINKPTSRPGTDGEQGTGFGMPLVKKFVMAYGGEINVSSIEKTKGITDHGTEVTLILEGVVK
ncbi:MAG TPA: hybrid sensor histidine kinase/response regulator [Spirochaetes bacterium]|nr:hybrid sensor histidine kinase/response regulator [Spirochaetota bacterium]